MYESPIQLYMTDVQTQIIRQQEEQILKAVQRVAVGVDHEELFRALKYDRDQYERGYQDAISDKNLVEVVRCKDCVYGEYAGLGKFMCDLHEFVGKGDFYCASGERKDNAV